MRHPLLIFLVVKVGMRIGVFFEFVGTRVGSADWPERSAQMFVGA